MKTEKEVIFFEINRGFEWNELLTLNFHFIDMKDINVNWK